MGHPWWFSGKESTCQCWRHRFSLCSRKIPHATAQLSLCTTAIEPVLWSWRTTTTEPTRHNYWSLCILEPVLHDEKPPQWEAQVPQLESSPCSLQLNYTVELTNRFKRLDQIDRVPKNYAWRFTTLWGGGDQIIPPKKNCEKSNWLL